MALGAPVQLNAEARRHIRHMEIPQVNPHPDFI